MIESEVAQFLRARMTEWRAAALEATHGTGSAEWSSTAAGEVILESSPETTDFQLNESSLAGSVVGELGRAGWHVALHSPARVLAEIDARLQLIDQCQRWLEDAADDGELRYLSTVAEIVLCLMALPWADHPDYDDDWAPIM